MSEEEAIDELTIEEVAEYAVEFGFELVLRGDTFGLSQGKRVIAVGTLDDLCELLNVTEEFATLTEMLSPNGTTIH